MILISPIKDIQLNQVFEVEINADLQPNCVLEFADQKGLWLAILYKQKYDKYDAYIISNESDNTLFSKATGSELKIIGSFKQVENGRSGALQFYYN
jgi:hypothetical protein